jgi:hypothetical protein
MSISLALLPTAAPILARHLGAYAELVAAEAAQLAQLLAQRLIAAVVALLGIVMTMLLACVWLLGTVWDTPWRSATLAALILLFAAVATTAVVLAARRWKTGAAPFAAVRQQWEVDRLLISAHASPEADVAVPAIPPQQKLRQSREELLLLLDGQNDQRGNAAFPRSATMRLLVGAGGRGIATTVAISALTGFLPKAARWLLRSSRAAH